MAQAYQARADVAQDVSRGLANSPFAAGIYLKHEDEGLEALTPEERWRLVRFSLGDLLRGDNTHFQYQQGFIDDEYYESVFKPLVRLRAPLWKELDFFAEMVRPAFAHDVDRILSESEA